MAGDDTKLTRRQPVALLGLGLILLVAAWIMATVPFAAPDEASHYLRALNIANGHLLGPKIRYPLSLPPAQQAFINHDTRAVLVPARLSPPDVNCNNGRPDLRGTCLEATPDGNFPPLGYLLPAVALRLTDHTSSAIWLTRVAAALPSLAFLMLAVGLLWSGTGWSVLGLLAACTPMVLFVSSVMSSSGIEIAACLAFVAAGLRLARAPARAPGAVWAAFAVAGVAAILAGPIGLEFAVADLAVLGVLLGRSGWRELREGGTGQLRLVAPALLAAAVVALIYSRLAGFSARFGITPIRASLHGGLDQLAPVLRDVVGTFGSLTVHLPNPVYWIWWLLVLVLVVVALGLGTRRERLLVAAVTVLALAFPVLFWAWVDRFTGFGLQGREVQPVLMLIPLVAGEVVYRHRAARALSGARSRAQLVPAVAIALVAMLQAYAWWYNARAEAGAPGTIRFYAHAVWSPPLGWLPWIALAGLGTVALLGFAAGQAWPSALGRSGRPSRGARAALRGSRPRSARSG